MSARHVLIGVMLLPVAVAACGGDDSTGSSGVVQVATVEYTPTAPTCGAQSVSTYTVAFRIEMVNTTTDAVTVTKVGTNGVIIDGTVEEDLGKAAHVFASLPFTPADAVLRPRDGDVHLVATMTVSCGVHPRPGTEAYRQISTSVYVTTTAGQYTTLPLSIRVIWRPI